MKKTLLGHKFAAHAGPTITLKYYGNEKLSPTRAMFASFSAKDNATMRGGGKGGWKGPGFTGRCFVSGPFSCAKDTVNLKPVKLLFLTCSSADVYARTFLILHKKGVGGGRERKGFLSDEEA